MAHVGRASRGRAAAQAAAEEDPMAQGVQGVEAGSGGRQPWNPGRGAQGHRESGEGKYK